MKYEASVIFPDSECFSQLIRLTGGAAGL